MMMKIMTAIIITPPVTPPTIAPTLLSSLPVVSTANNVVHIPLLVYVHRDSLYD